MLNTRWHRDNPRPLFPRSALLGWHLRHEAACSCSAMPEFVLRELDEMGVIVPGHTSRPDGNVAVTARALRSDA
jgi:hypothetical protein